jgi:hypothetical protein
LQWLSLLAEAEACLQWLSLLAEAEACIFTFYLFHQRIISPSKSDVNLLF